MISTKRNTPEIYYNESRDFQALGRTFDLIFNYLKTATDTIKNNPISKNSDIRLIDLATRTLGFESKRTYDVNDLNALCNGFKSTLMKKGSKQAIEDCVKILLKSQNIDKDFTVNIINKTETPTTSGGSIVYHREVEIYVPSEIKDIALLEDILDYVLPTGYTYNIIESNVFNNNNWGVELYSKDTVEFKQLKSFETGIVVGETNEDLRANVDLRPGAKLSDSELEIADKGITDDVQAVQPDIAQEQEDADENEG